MAEKYKICTKCVLDSSESSIYFNKEGVCSFCEELEKYTKCRGTISKDSLDQLVMQVKNSGHSKEYDCIIGLSGGVDSSYVAYVVKQCGLRPLAVHLDNGWNNELAVANIENICKKLDIDLYTYVIDWEEFRDLQKSFLSAGVANAEAPTDHAIFAILYQLAKKFSIKYILDGVNFSTEKPRSRFTGAGYIYSDLRQIKGIHRKFGSVPLNTFPKMSFYKKFYFQHILKIRQISILNYIEYNKSNAIKLLQDELNWKDYGGKHHESLFTKWHQVIYLPKRFNFDKRKLHFSDLILSGEMVRESAIRELQSPPIDEAESKLLEEYVQKKLGYSKQEYNQLLLSPPKTYRDYPNDEWILKIYMKLKGK